MSATNRTEAEKARLRYNLRAAVHSAELEGGEPMPIMIELIEKHIEGEITTDEVMQQLRLACGLEAAPHV